MKTGFRNGGTDLKTGSQESQFPAPRSPGRAAQTEDTDDDDDDMLKKVARPIVSPTKCHSGNWCLFRHRRVGEGPIVTPGITTGAGGSFQGLSGDLLTFRGDFFFPSRPRRRPTAHERAPAASAQCHVYFYFCFSLSCFVGAPLNTRQAPQFRISLAVNSGTLSPNLSEG